MVAGRIIDCVFVDTYAQNEAIVTEKAAIYPRIRSRNFVKCIIVDGCRIIYNTIHRCIYLEVPNKAGTCTNNYRNVF